MRTAVLFAALAGLLVPLAGCAQTRSAYATCKHQVSRLAGCCGRRAPPACAPASAPASARAGAPLTACCYSEEIYPNRCGGDNGIGRGGTGAFRVP